MFVPISNTPRDYAWGSTTAIADFLGTNPTGAPQAELWLGAHPGSPSRLSPVSWQLRGARTLDEWIAADPSLTLGLPKDAVGDAARLPYLLKVLAAEAPLSLQAHPTAAQAREGFARENAEGVPLDAPHRNYRDPYAKPELIVAVSERFDALCGFRDVSATAGILTTLIESAEHHGLTAERLTAVRDGLADPLGLASVVEHILGADAELVDETAAACDAALALLGGADAPADAADDEPRAAIETARDLAERHPTDSGVVLSLLLNRVTLRPGEALWLPAGNIHAYLSGLGMELMEASDNVLRGGLTGKHVDVPELMRVLSFESGPPPRLSPVDEAEGVRAYRPEAAGFELLHVQTGDGRSRHVSLPGASILLAVSGSVHVRGDEGSTRLARGLSVFATASERSIEVSGDGSLYVATSTG